MPHDQNKDITPLGFHNFRGNKEQKFGIKLDDRRRHVYVVGKTGVGKSTLLENMAIADIKSGKGIAFIDPHGSSAEMLLDFIPENRLDDVIYFDPSDMEHPVAFNPMEQVGTEFRHLVASGIMGVFKKIWVDAWSARMEYILNNTLLALLEYPGSTLLGVLRMFSEPPYRKNIVDNLKDPIIKAFWQNEFARYSQKLETEALAAIQNKVGQFVSNPLIRNILGQSRSTINMRDIMDSGKIFIANLSGGIIPVGATFFAFSDYMRSAIRVAAISEAPVRYLFSHDSIGLGQDGPTHQPVDQLCSLRAIPGLDVIRPADANECEAVFDAFLAVDGPAAMILSRQALPVLDEVLHPAVGTPLDGAYVLSDPAGAQATLVATGSEVHLCLEAAAPLEAAGMPVRVVSMPCWEWFDATSFEYQASVFPEDLPVLSVEAGVTLGWERYADESIGIDTFGVSAPGDVALEFFGFTASAVASTVKELLGA